MVDSRKASSTRPHGWRLACLGLSLLLLSGCAGDSLAHQSSGDDVAIQKGVASFYSDRFQGRTTASGEPFDQQALTAAHRTLPFGTKVLVTRRDTGRQVEVEIIDRGPFVSGRVIDLSKRAARALGMLGRGTAPVQLSYVR
ncbi:septal ring lytic transglycosylase RlpA family protein [Halomonas nitroreducens]|uniref:Endolytic peptidoglycan transglycosylase RlpA n=1 Tax=Halomonas nitroreducens TaxID=447425 RepID=A0A3S0JVX8_9GAMM|nr:septal ring lytic transglycosylase RlpA family protein [Halomonas nitroreducens]RTR00223.1 septal ring lytic transglycosylase RlpA family protein [Halomonas nitroreducens]